MHFPLALLQASDDKTVLIFIGVLTLGLMAALGKRFFTAMFEVITAPQASLGHHGKDNTFFFAIMVVFLGGMLGVLYLISQQPQISADFKQFAAVTGEALAQSNGNPNYREVAAGIATGRIDNALQTYVVGNFMWFPLVAVISWLLQGCLFWLCSKMFGVQVSLSDFLGSLSFPFFFSAIASALTLPMGAKALVSQLFLQPPSTDFPIVAIIGCVISLYAFILFCMAVVQSAEITAGQFIVILLLLGILGGGVQYYLMTQQFAPMAAAFSSEITSFDPAGTGGGGGGEMADVESAPPSGPVSAEESGSGGGGMTPDI